MNIWFLDMYPPRRCWHRNVLSVSLAKIHTHAVIPEESSFVIVNSSMIRLVGATKKNQKNKQHRIDGIKHEEY